MHPGLSVLLSATFNMHLFDFLCIVCIMQLLDRFSLRKGAVLPTLADKLKTDGNKMRHEFVMLRHVTHMDLGARSGLAATVT